MQALGFHKQRDAKIERIAQQPLFATCTEADLRSLAKVCDEVEVSTGYCPARQGWHGPWFFVIEKGAAEVVRNDRKERTLGPGEYFGENALLGAPHPVTVRALTDMTLLVFGRRDSSVTMEGVPSLARRFFGIGHRRSTPSQPANVVHVQFQPRKAHRIRIAPVLVAAAAIGVAGWIGSEYRPGGLAVVSPGPAMDISRDVTITGAPTSPLNGRYLAPTVRVERPNLWGFALAALRSDREIIAVKNSNSSSAIAVRRQHQEFEQSRRMAAAAAARASGLVVGITYSDNGVDIDLPFEIEFSKRDLRGPSAGLVYALLIADILEPKDLAAGRTIGASGTISPDGRIGPVTGVAQKAAGVAAYGATLFIAPFAQAREGVGLAVRVPGASNLKDAVATLLFHT